MTGGSLRATGAEGPWAPGARGPEVGAAVSAAPVERGLPPGSGGAGATVGASMGGDPGWRVARTGWVRRR